MEIQLPSLASRMSGVGEPRVAGGCHTGEHSRTLPAVLDVTAQLVDGSLGHLCPTTDLSAVSSHPLHLILLMVTRCLLCRSSKSVMTHSCLKTSVGYWHVVCAPSTAHESSTAHSPAPPDLPSKLRDPCFSPLPRPSLLAIPPFISLRLTGSSSFSGSDISPLPCSLCLLPWPPHLGGVSRAPSSNVFVHVPSEIIFYKLGTPSHGTAYVSSISCKVMSTYILSWFLTFLKNQNFKWFIFVNKK